MIYGNLVLYVLRGEKRQKKQILFSINTQDLKVKADEIFYVINRD